MHAFFYNPESFYSGAFDTRSQATREKKSNMHWQAHRQIRKPRMMLLQNLGLNRVSSQLEQLFLAPSIQLTHDIKFKLLAGVRRFA